MSSYGEAARFTEKRVVGDVLGLGLGTPCGVMSTVLVKIAPDVVSANKDSVGLPCITGESRRVAQNTYLVPSEDAFQEKCRMLADERYSLCMHSQKPVITSPETVMHETMLQDCLRTVLKPK